MTDILSIGPFNIYVPYLLAALSAFVATVWAMALIKYYHLQKGSHIAGEWLQSWIVVILIWKFSYVLIHPIKAFENILSLIYFDGGDLGFYLGTIIAIYLFLKNTKMYQPNPLIRMNLLVSTSLFFLGFYQLIQYFYFDSKGWILLIAGIYSLSLSVLFLRKKSWMSKIFIIRIGQWFLFGWIGLKVIQKSIYLFDWNIWIAFVLAFLLVGYDFRYSKGE